MKVLVTTMVMVGLCLAADTAVGQGGRRRDSYARSTWSTSRGYYSGRYARGGYGGRYYTTDRSRSGSTRSSGATHDEHWLFSGSSSGGSGDGFFGRSGSGSTIGWTPGREIASTPASARWGNIPPPPPTEEERAATKARDDNFRAAMTDYLKDHPEFQDELGHLAGR